MSDSSVSANAERQDLSFMLIAEEKSTQIRRKSKTAYNHKRPNSKKFTPAAYEL